MIKGSMHQENINIHGPKNRAPSKSQHTEYSQ